MASSARLAVPAAPVLPEPRTGPAVASTVHVGASGNRRGHTGSSTEGGNAAVLAAAGYGRPLAPVTRCRAPSDNGTERGRPLPPTDPKLAPRAQVTVTALITAEAALRLPVPDAGPARPGVVPPGTARRQERVPRVGRARQGRVLHGEEPLHVHVVPIRHVRPRPATQHHPFTLAEGDTPRERHLCCVLPGPLHHAEKLQAGARPGTGEAKTATKDDDTPPPRKANRGRTTTMADAVAVVTTVPVAVAVAAAVAGGQ